MFSREVEMAEKKLSPDHTTAIHLGSPHENHFKITPRGAGEIFNTLTKEEQEVLGRLSKSDAMLIGHRGPGMGSRFLLSSLTLIGRDPVSDIFLDDVTISRKHAQISLEEERYVLEDLGSLNGTYVNGSSVVRVVLDSSDEIQIGKFHMLFFGGNQ